LKDGWYWTGDMGKMKGIYIYLVDRKSDMIKSGGEKVYPFEVENVLYEHPSIDEVIVVGAPDPKWGQRVHAAIKLKKKYAKEYKGKEEELEQLLKDYCHEHLAGYKCPKSFEFWKKSLPKTAVGKPLRKELKEKFKEE
ncbi:MAG: class I adenylate-forming enzyme family protein, partial [Candidatus Hermodarchaeota archaeon]